MRESENTKVSSNPTEVGAIFRQSVSENYSRIFSKTKDHYPRTKKILQTRWAPLTISHQSAMFGGYGPFGRGNITLSIIHVIKRDHMVRGLCEIMS